MSENKIALRKEQIELVQELAQVIESLGMQPAMAKILALLTVNDELELTFDQIKETLGLSKSAVSQAITYLHMRKLINYKTKLGDRKRYFYTKIGAWQEHVANQFERTHALVQVYNKLLKNRTKKTKEFNQSLRDLADFITALKISVSSTLAKFQQKKA